LGDIAPEKSEDFLRLMKVKKAAEIKRLLKHHDETAGGLMTTEFISLPQNLTVEQAINKLRDIGPSAETIFYVYVVDDNDCLVGVLSLRNLIVSAPHKRLHDIMIKNCITISPDANQRQVADIISKYNLLAMPVVDKEKKILGIVTVDDVVDFILPPVSRRRRHMIG
jgi:Mg/Co/Ni transporter MgtE